MLLRVKQARTYRPRRPDAAQRALALARLGQLEAERREILAFLSGLRVDGGRESGSIRTRVARRRST